MFLYITLKIAVSPNPISADQPLGQGLSDPGPSESIYDVLQSSSECNESQPSDNELL